MRIYRLAAINPTELPFTPSQDRNFGFVIRANNEQAAMEMADAESKSEGFGTWLNPALTSCELVDPNLGPLVLSREYFADSC